MDGSYQTRPRLGALSAEVTMRSDKYQFSRELL